MTDLKHVGVLGMHWGQHKAGPDSADHTVSRELKRKPVRELSNAEITKITTRLQLEKNLKSLDSHEMSRGQKLVKSLLTRFGPMAATILFKRYVQPHFNEAMDNATKKASSHFHNDPGVINGTVAN